MLFLKKRRFLFLQCSLLVLFFLFSALLVACNSGPSSAATFSPTPTFSLQMGDVGVSPTPTPFAYACGAWATQTTPPYGTDRVGINAKFTKLVDGNPQGIGGANATATIHWPDGTTDTQTVQTTFDGLAVFTVQTANRMSAINKITLVTVQFDKPGVATCDVSTSRAAFFTLIAVTPTTTPGATATANANGH